MESLRLWDHQGRRGKAAAGYCFNLTPTTTWISFSSFVGENFQFVCVERDLNFLLVFVLEHSPQPFLWSVLAKHNTTRGEQNQGTNHACKENLLLLLFPPPPWFVLWWLSPSPTTLFLTRPRCLLAPSSPLCHSSIKAQGGLNWIKELPSLFSPRNWYTHFPILGNFKAPSTLNLGNVVSPTKEQMNFSGSCFLLPNYQNCGCFPLS